MFIHSSVSRHLGCVHVLAVVNSTAMNIGVNVYFQIMVFSRYMPRNKAAGAKKSRIALLLAFQGASMLFSIVAITVYVPTNNAGRLLLLHTLSSIYYLFVFFFF